MKRLCALLGTLVTTGTLAAAIEATPPRPNVILIMTDDQGYGEIAAHGNPIIKTPHMDALHAESARFTDFHVDPTCSPTRAALATGRYSTRTGVWHTINGRSIMAPGELTLAEVFKANGYDTALFGKWHIGDNYPCRPQDQGYDHVALHPGGAISHSPDYWGNDYYDDMIQINGEWTPTKGYITDVWFDHTLEYIEKKRDKPFFISLHTNAPHDPWIVPVSYAAPYREAGLSKTMAIFYGMITSIDDNLGRLRQRLAELDLAENTLLIFMTDNGTTAGWINYTSKDPYYNAGMRGWKSSAYEGGHRVPLFWHWPAGGLTQGSDIPKLSAHIDILPTLVDLLALKQPAGPPLDGMSLAPLLRDPAATLRERTLFAHVQRQYLPPKWDNSATMAERWRLIDGVELYDIQADPGQTTDLAARHPETVARLRAEYEAWWQSMQCDMQQTVRYAIGGDENPMTISAHDWLIPPGERDAIWNQKQIRRGEIANGPWALDVETAGTYEISLHRWAPYLKKPMGMIAARLRVGDLIESQSLEEDATKASFNVDLPAGPTTLKTWLRNPGPERAEQGAYYLHVRLLKEQH